jgi:hypothetical protein
MIYNRALKDYYLDSERRDDEFIPFLLGRNAFNYLISSLNIKIILLPSFICPMIVDIFKNAGIKIFFYNNLDSQLSFSIKPILEILPKISVENNTFFLWHDYLNLIGDMPDELYKELESNNIKSIVDATHSLPSKVYKSPNVVFGFRKLLDQPFGALLKIKEQKYLPTNEVALIKVFKFLVFHKIQSIIFTIFKRFNNNLLNSLLKKISIFGGRYSFDKNEYFIGENYNFKKILSLHSRLDYNKIGINRRKNFLQYLSAFPQKLNLNSLDISCPYGFPLMVDNNKEIRNKLWNVGIHSFILWGTIHPEVPGRNNNINYLLKSLLILPVNQDLSSDDIKKIIKIINVN